MKEIKILDTMLRDGNHTLSNMIDLDDIKNMVSSLDKAGLDYIEVGYGYGIGVVDEKCLATDEDIIKTAVENSNNSKIAVMVFPNRAELKDVEMALKHDIGMLRVSTQASDVKPGKAMIDLATKSGVHTNGFMMMAHRVEVQELVEQAEILESYGVDSISIVDSAGFMETNEVREKVTAVREAIDKDIEIGFHCHDNLGLAVGNSVAAIESGATIIDTAIAGLGAGAGNTPTEFLVATLDKSGYETESDLYKVLDSARHGIDIAKKHGVEIKSNEDTLIIGYTGAYSTFLGLAKELAQKYNSDFRIIIEGAANEKLVPGQEDRLEEIAKENSKKV